jgi:toxin ParE1/3/4
VAQRVAWSPRAIADVEAIAAYIASDSPSYANAVVRRIVALTQSLREFPLSGRKVPEFDDDGIRELIAYKLPDHLSCAAD